MTLGRCQLILETGWEEGCTQSWQKCVMLFLRPINKHFCRTTLKSRSKESIEKSALCENTLFSWKCRMKWTFVNSLSLQRNGLIFSLLKTEKIHHLFCSEAKTPEVMVLVLGTSSSKSLLSRNPWILVANQSETLCWLLTYTFHFFRTTLIFLKFILFK